MRVLIAVFAMIWGGTAAAAELEAGRLTVTGEGRIASVPDMATITLGVVHEAPTAAVALDAASAATGAVLDGLAADGVAARDIQTRDLALRPVWSNRSSTTGSPPRITGFQASNTVVVRVRDLDALGGILDRVVSRGANLFQGLSFGLQDPAPLQDRARRDAVAEAQRRARLYADAAGLTLGPVLLLNEAGTSPVPVQMLRLEAMEDAVPIAQGEVRTTASVTMVFAIGP